MKLRKAFVSNSSSSSFICAVTGYEDTYYTDDNGEIAVQCRKCGSIFYKEFLKDEKFIKHTGMIDEERCPVCRIMTVFKNNNINYSFDHEDAELLITAIEHLRIEQGKVIIKND